MGSLVGNFFEKHVKHKLTADGEVQLRYMPIGKKSPKEKKVKIPSNFEELKTLDKVVAIQSFVEGVRRSGLVLCHWIIESDTLAASDNQGRDARLQHWGSPCNHD